ncbi:hypothetical protein C8T65DRAFT_712522 [Cerioporus squamosus]|nr:hypothetical protein C8T65DRAFT_712522 [Cerioporus squamosus]
MIDGLTLECHKWEERGWIDVENADVFRDTLARLRARSARTTFQWVKGHTDVRGNEEADKLAKLGAETIWQETDKLPEPKKALIAVTQSLAYRGILRSNKDGKRPATEEMTGRRTTEAMLWKSMRHRDFLWRCMHDSLKGFEERMVCTVCGVSETIEHLLVDCESEATMEIRRLLTMILRKKVGKPVNLPLGALLGATTRSMAMSNEDAVPAVDRFCKIAITESVCARTIEFAEDTAKWHSASETRGKWYACLNRRLALERNLTYKRLGDKALPRGLVEGTWSGVLNGVLVGRLDDG